MKEKKLYMPITTVDKHLWEWLKQSALQEHRTIGQQVRHILWKVMEDETQE